MTGSKKASLGDNRRSIKISDPLWKAVSKEIAEHPEWGIRSVSEFVRRAIDHELSARKALMDRKTFEIILNGLARIEGNRDRDS